MKPITMRIKNGYWKWLAAVVATAAISANAGEAKAIPSTTITLFTRVCICAALIGMCTVSADTYDVL